MKTRLLFFAMTASIFLASWGAALNRFLSWSDGQLDPPAWLDSPCALRRGSRSSRLLHRGRLRRLLLSAGGAGCLYVRDHEDV